MALPLARLAKPGETPSVWPRRSLDFKRYGIVVQHLRRQARLSQTPNAILLREKRAGHWVPLTHEQRRAIQKEAARKRREGVPLSMSKEAVRKRKYLQKKKDGFVKPSVN